MFVSMVLALALAAGPEGAQAAQAPAEAKPAAAKAPKTRRVCHTPEAPTSTRLARKVCVTQKVEEDKPAAETATQPSDAAAK